MAHLYAFVKREDSLIPIYERTFARMETARRWMAAKPHRFITIDSLPKRYWY